MSALQILDRRAGRTLRRIGLVVAVAFGLGLVVSSGTALAASATDDVSTAGGTDHPVIIIKNFAYTGDLTVRAGVTVTVRNADAVIHTLTAVDGSFTTKTIQPGKAAKFKAPKKAGNFAITCIVHPRMAGLLVVGTRPPKHPVITIKNFAYTGDLTVRPGAKVTVRNADAVMHTLTAADGSFDTMTIQPGKSATFRAPKKKGAYPVICIFHKSMHATLTVGDLVLPPPPPPPPPPPATVTITGFAFTGMLTVAPGAMVTVTNADPVMHTLTAVDGSFTTPTIAAGMSATFQAPTTPGAYMIKCIFHASMSGTLTVAATPAPAAAPPVDAPVAAGHVH
jgi:plastocyanin